MEASWGEIVTAIILIIILFLFLAMILKPSYPSPETVSECPIRKHGFGIGIRNPTFQLQEREI